MGSNPIQVWNFFRSNFHYSTTQVLVVFITAKIALIFISLVSNRLSVSQTCDPKMQMAFLLKSPEHPHRNHLKMIPSHQQWKIPWTYSLYQANKLHALWTLSWKFRIKQCNLINSRSRWLMNSLNFECDHHPISPYSKILMNHSWHHKTKGNDCQSNKLWLLNKFSLSAPVQMRREE